jgi:hypothetical protein
VTDVVVYRGEEQFAGWPTGTAQWVRQTLEGSVEIEAIGILAATPAL